MEGAPRVRFVEAVKKALGGYSDYRSRSRRSEYWFWVLFCALIGIVLSLISLLLTSIFQSEVPSGILSLIVAICLFVFSLPLGVRRFHDIGRSGWFMLLGLIPIIGGLIIMCFFLQDSQREQNQWGPSPKYGGATDGFLPSETV